jgi:signal transduction histidine kinase
MQQTDDAQIRDNASLCAEIERLKAQVAQLRSQAKEAQDHEQLLCEITRHLVPGTNVSAMLFRVLSPMLTFTRADAASIVLLNERGRIVNQVSQLAGHPQDEARPYQALQQTLNSGLTEWIIAHKQAALIVDTAADERWTRVPGAPGDVRSALAIPLCYHGRMLGLLGLASHLPNHLEERHLDALISVTAQICTAIENRRLVEEAQRRTVHLRLVNMVSHEIGAVLDIDQLLWQVVRRILDTLDCYYVTIALIEDGELVFRAGIDYLYRSTEPLPLALSEGIPGRVIRLNRSILVSDVLQDERYRPLNELSDARSELAVPLRIPTQASNGLEVEKQIIGVLDVRSTEVSAFTMDDQELLESLAAQVARAIDNARLFGRVRNERATLEAILNGTGDAIIVTDPADKVLFFSPAARQAFLNGSSLPPAGELPEVLDNRALLSLWKDFAEQGFRSTEVPLPDGRTFYASLTALPGVGKVAVMQDISRLKELDQIKSEFVSTVSHDLRSPLQAIQTSAELLPKLGELTREQKKEVVHIQAIVRRMSKLVQNLLDIGRIEAGIGMEAEPCALDEIIASAAGSFRGLAEKKGLDFALEVPQALPLVKGNPLRVDQVVSNLVSNAIKFTLEGSVIVRAWADNGQAILEVTDTGLGIPLEAQDNLYQKFYRVKSPETRGIRGTGLGLAIAKSIVESYGGQIDLESYPRLGSTFRVSFPVWEDKIQ